MLLTSSKNDWIRQLRRLHQTKGRREQSAFLIEGTHLVQEALANQWPLSAICHTPTWLEHHPGLLDPVPRQVRIQPVTEAVLISLATTETPDGVIAVGHHLEQPAVPQCQLALAVETLQDPGNLGSLIRSGAAAGADAIWVTSDSVDPEHPKVLRASAGQWFRLSPQVVQDLPQWLTRCQQHQIQVLAATLPQRTEARTAMWDYDLCKPTVFILGNEGAGLSQPMIQQANGTIHIPMATGVESLNVGVTGALLLFEAYRQRWQVRSLI